MFSPICRANYKLAEAGVLKLIFFDFMYVHTTNKIQARARSVFTDRWFHLRCITVTHLSELCEVLVGVPHSQPRHSQIATLAFQGQYCYKLYEHMTCHDLVTIC